MWVWLKELEAKTCCVETLRIETLEALPLTSQSLQSLRHLGVLHREAFAPRFAPSCYKVHLRGEGPSGHEARIARAVRSEGSAAGGVPWSEVKRTRGSRRCGSMRLCPNIYQKIVVE